MGVPPRVVLKHSRTLFRALTVARSSSDFVQLTRIRWTLHAVIDFDNATGGER